MNRAARLWLTALVAQLAAVVWLARGWLVVLLLQLTFVAGTTYLARRADRDRARLSGVELASRSSPAWRLPWIICNETLCFAVTQWLMALEPWVALGRAPHAARYKRPLLLIHGVYCNRAVWWALRRRLQREGFGPIETINLDPAWSSIERHVDATLAGIRQLQQVDPQAAATIVAHSMGGLVARRALRDPRLRVGEVAQIVTIGTPHAGSRFAGWCEAGACVEMRPGSEWLEALNEVPESVAVVSIYSTDDNLVAPRANASLPGATDVPLTGLGHFALLWSRGVHARVIELLTNPAPPFPHGQPLNT